MSSDPRPKPALAVDVDANARASALDVTASFIVQAPAGSGKTELLIQRFLSLLAEVKEPENILAITFTRKASGEMRTRIMKALREASQGKKPTREHELQRYELASRVLARDRELGWNLLQTPSRLRIQTIDSLCHSIVRMLPLTSGLGTPRGIAEKGDDLYVVAARRTVQLVGKGGKTAESIRRALIHIDNNVRQLEESIVSMLKRRDQWLRHIPGGDTTKLRAEMEETLGRLIAESLDAARQTIPPKVLQKLVRLAKVAAGNMLQKDPAHPVVSCDGLMQVPACEAGMLPAWRGLVSILLKKSDGEWYSEGGINARIGFPTKDRDAKDELVDLIAELRGISGARAALESIRSLPEPRYSDSQWEAMEAFLCMLPAAVDQLQRVFVEQQMCDFMEVSRAAQNALSGEAGIPDFVSMFGYSIEHLLVDEFQDTSVSQVQLLHSLTRNWAQGDGQTLFLVGDPMQSIYRFRQAEVGTFLHVAREKKFGTLKVGPLRLTRNFRSRRAIVDWVNGTFPDVMPDTTASDRQKIAASIVSFKSSECAAKDRDDRSEVRVHVQFGSSEEAREQEATEVVRTVQELRTRGEKVAVLVRSRKHLFSIVERLRAAELKFQAVEIDTLASQLIINDLRALTNALLHPGHRVAWLAVLRAPWCGLTLADLYTLCAGENSATIWDLLQGRGDQLSQDGQRRLARILPVLSEALRQRGRVGLRQWIESTWLSLNGPACLQEARDLEDASTFFDVLDELDCGSDVESLEKLDQAIADLYAGPDPEADDSIQLMTIHKAKGLEFDSVLLPGMGRSTSGQDRRLLLWDERASDPGTELIMAPMRPKGGDRDPIYDFLKKLEDERGDNESRRLLYVGVTRAKHELHLFGHIGVSAQEFLEEAKGPRSGSFLDMLWPRLQSDFIQQAETQLSQTSESGLQLAAATDIGARRTLQRLPLHWAAPELPKALEWVRGAEPENVAPEEGITYDWAGERARRIGTVVHSALQRIADEGLAEWSVGRLQNSLPAFRSALSNEGVGPNDMEEALSLAVKAIDFALKDEKGRWLLGEQPEAQNECALTGVDGGQVFRLVIDRTFVANGIRWIIDYKTGHREGGDREAFLDNEVTRYKEKMERYARVMRNKDSREIRLGLYFPLMGGWREWSSSGE